MKRLLWDEVEPEFDPDDEPAHAATCRCQDCDERAWLRGEHRPPLVPEYLQGELRVDETHIGGDTFEENFHGVTREPREVVAEPGFL